MPDFLIIGGAGYIGSHVVLELVREGHNVTVLDNLSTGHRESIAGVDCRFVHGDLGDPSLLQSIFGGGRIDCVMHFAAFSLVGESVQLPLKYYWNNTAGTIRLLTAMIEAGVDRFIFSSTAAVYGEPEQIPMSKRLMGHG